MRRKRRTVCSNCGTENLVESKFCSTCGNALNIREETNEDGDFSKDELVIPKSLLNCEILRIGGKRIEFIDEKGNKIVIVKKLSGGVLANLSLEFDSLSTQNGRYEPFMVCRRHNSDDGYTQTAYDKNGQLIGSANYNSGLKSMRKTVIKIKDSKGEDYLLEEKVGFIKGILKIISPADYAMWSLIAARTGDLIIKENNIIIGEIKSIRNAFNNTYIIKNCVTLRKTMDIRLIILGMTIKNYYTK